ncbi:MAG: pyridoxal-5'-phosphate-dependent protein [Candidatus Firestonebacteria bacterium RIFOXYC2_FULL_39_67]|nr:MAG: pyridoxal-5'-phosphate-dependent protein [Candidatus Firestonebacteria bacterium RIFOXYC2_FULL_39_67]OGF57294.1 MAG: pyridoxal-5'-phosphate-dependent protein [Candidatus Firestonebacteria bacterium RifOxyC12_full_39_7]
MIPVFRPSVGKEELEAVKKVMLSGWLGLGPKTAEFEEEFARFMGVKYAVGMNSATAALHLALFVLNIKKGDEVLVPTITFVSTAHVVRYCGATPVFVDINRKTMNMDINDLKRKITKRTKTIIAVHYAGHPCEMDEIHKIAKENKIFVIEDAAHACGAKYKGKRVGSMSDMTCFSFHAVKNLTTGEGGMVTTDNKEWHDSLKKLRWLGINKDTWVRSKRKGAEKASYAWQYSVENLGFKCHMHDISAAIGLVQLKKLDRGNKKRHEIFVKYNEAFKDLDWVEVPIEKDYVESSHHIYALKVEKRDKLVHFLKENGIGPGVHYFPVHLFPYYSGSNVKLPAAESTWKKLVSLPIYPTLSKKQIDHVIKTVRLFV